MSPTEPAHPTAPAAHPTAPATHPSEPAGPTRPEPASGQDDIVDAEIVPDDVAVAGGVAGGTPAGFDGAVPGLDYTFSGVPTLDYVRARIEGRLGSAAGATELAEAELARTAQADPKSVAAAARAAEQRAADREQAARDRLEQIRRGMGQ